LLAIETGKPRDDMIPLLDFGGVPLSAEPIVDAVNSRLRTADIGLRMSDPGPRPQSAIRYP
jgi:hypothetical protein